MEMGIYQSTTGKTWLFYHQRYGISMWFMVAKLVYSDFGDHKTKSNKDIWGVSPCRMSCWTLEDRGSPPVTSTCWCCSFFGANFDHMPLGRHDAIWVSPDRLTEDSSLARANHGWGESPSCYTERFRKPMLTFTWMLFISIDIYIVNGVHGI